MGARRFQRATLLIKPMDGGMQVILGGVDLSARDFAALAAAAAQALTLSTGRARGLPCVRTPRRRRSPI